MSPPLGVAERPYLGNLDDKRDGGPARDYIRAMWIMLQQEEPDDYVLVTGQTYAVGDLAELAFGQSGVTIEWRGRGAEEVGVDPAWPALLSSRAISGRPRWIS